MRSDINKPTNFIITMQHQKCSLDLYIDFLTASQKQFSGVELSKVSPEPMAHDSVSRWLAKEKLTPKLVWKEAEHLAYRNKGCLILDDTVLDKALCEKDGLG